ncbi:hypothetical protein HDG35_003611 [Paraburkholderia sp. JPY681]|nr:hypothetical protein [Paraburkholderia atlantica]
MDATLHAKIRRHILVRTRCALLCFSNSIGSRCNSPTARWHERFECSRAARPRASRSAMVLAFMLSLRFALPHMASLKPRAARALITGPKNRIGKNVLALFPHHVGWNRTQKRTNLPRFFGPNSPSGENFVVRRAMHFSKREARRIPIPAGFGDAR